MCAVLQVWLKSAFVKVGLMFQPNDKVITKTLNNAHFIWKIKKIIFKPGSIKKKKKLSQGATKTYTAELIYTSLLRNISVDKNNHQS